MFVDMEIFKGQDRKPFNPISLLPQPNKSFDQSGDSVSFIVIFSGLIECCALAAG
jgi:hypothetical protein